MSCRAAPGVYGIKNLITGKYYIGSSKNVKGRMTIHFDALSKGKHTRKLQSSWNKYGKDNFRFRVIRYCKIEHLIRIEQYYIEFYNAIENGYNISPIAGSCLGVKHTKQTKKKHSINQKRIARENKAEILRRSRQASKQCSKNKFGRNCWNKESEEKYKKVHEF